MMTNPILLLVDDDAEIREQMKWALMADYQVVEAEDRRSAIAAVKREMPPLVVLDLGLPPAIDASTEGFAILQEIMQINPSSKVVVVTGNTDRANALAAIAGGAYDFLEKPVQLDLLKTVLQRAWHVASLEQENRVLRENVSGGFEELLGVSPAMQVVYDKIRRVAGSDVPVLIQGETGTGKELVARAIHRQSPRKDEPFVAINCGAIPETLIESELFGHEKGSFTGAHKLQKGKVEFAHQGTLFLDEIGDLAMPMQVKLLRFLQEGKIERVGGRESIGVDVRIVAATNVPLQEAMEQGKFREDLFYRLGVVELVVPPLRERGEDTLVLARAFLSRYKSLNAKVNGLSQEACDAIRSYGWPGNVRQLENRMKRAVLMARGGQLTPEDLELKPAEQATGMKTLREARAQLEKGMIQQALALHNGN
ncbi:MAG: PEP-CTERM-box response regulator transcription factor, partial [Nitrospira sp.]|nr:PEP-CTERM-box response regulator transcription factor [Nitrospira sp.]